MPTMSNLAWDDALWGLAALAADPKGLNGIWLKCALGPVMQEWLDWLHALKGNCAKIPSSIDTERLLGGLDLALTLQQGKPVRQKGILAQQEARILVCPMAERFPESTSSILTQVLDTRQVHSHHGHETQETLFGLIAIDESTPQEQSISRSLSEQLSIWLDLSMVPPGVGASDETLEMLERTEKKLHNQGLYYIEKIQKFPIVDSQIREVCELSKGFGIDSMRAPLFTLRLATVFALLRESTIIQSEDLGRAARLVLTPRATCIPQMESTPADEPTPKEDSTDLEEPCEPSPAQSTEQTEHPSDSQVDETNSAAQSNPKDPEIKALETSILEAALATLPIGLLNELAMGPVKAHKGPGGKVGATQRSAKKGRPLPPIKGSPQNGNRLHILSTLRHAAPRQRIRGNTLRWHECALHDRQAEQRLKIWSEDFHIQRFAQRSESCMIFCIDASGSAALERLAEAKGAVELLLKDSYSRRDHICVISFRNKGADIQLPPTRSLVRAKRQLQALPGGGGTPLASAIKLSLDTALQARQHGMSPTLVILSDGRANVTLQGEGSRPIAKAQALSWANVWRAAHIKGIWLDTSVRPEPNAQEIANAMGAKYVPLPMADGTRMAKTIEHLQSQGD